MENRAALVPGIARQLLIKMRAPARFYSGLSLRKETTVPRWRGAFEKALILKRAPEGAFQKAHSRKRIPESALQKALIEKSKLQGATIFEGRHYFRKLPLFEKGATI